VPRDHVKDLRVGREHIEPRCVSGLFTLVLLNITSSAFLISHTICRCRNVTKHNGGAD